MRMYLLLPCRPPAGHGFFVSPFVGYNICSDPATGQPVGKLTLDTTVPGAGGWVVGGWLGCWLAGQAAGWLHG